MKIQFRRKRVGDAEGVVKARRARIESETRLHRVMRELVEPLSAAREENHITEDVRELIARKVDRAL